MSSGETVFADRSDRAKLKFTGPQRLWFLHQILTQAFEDLEPGESRDACMITAHGRMIGFLEAVATEDAVLAHFESELRPHLPEEISKYVFATQVEIEDVTDAMGLVLIAGERWKEAAALAPAGTFIHPTASVGPPAGYVWIIRADLEDFLFVLGEEGLRETPEDELERVRVEHGVPRWGRDMDQKTLAPEAGIAERAVHLDKGCYLGQEAIAKIHFRGKVNRRLMRLRADRPLRAGADVFAGEEKVGRVTSAADGSGLAMLRYSVEPGTRVRAGDADAVVVG